MQDRELYGRILGIEVYDVRAVQISGGPKWLDSEKYDILADTEDSSRDRYAINGGFDARVRVQRSCQTWHTMSRDEQCSGTV